MYTYVVRERCTEGKKMCTLHTMAIKYTWRTLYDGPWTMVHTIAIIINMNMNFVVLLFRCGAREWSAPNGGNNNNAIFRSKSWKPLVQPLRQTFGSRTYCRVVPLGIVILLALWPNNKIDEILWTNYHINIFFFFRSMSYNTIYIKCCGMHFEIWWTNKI